MDSTPAARAYELNTAQLTCSQVMSEYKGINSNSEHRPTPSLASYEWTLKVLLEFWTPPNSPARKFMSEHKDIN